MVERAQRRVLRDTASETLRGIGLVTACYIAMTIGDVATKWALPVAGITGALIWRGIFGGVVVAGLSLLPNDVGPRGWWRLIPRRRFMVALRSVLAGLVSVAFYASWERMSLADSYAIGYTTPLVMTLFAVPMLHERIPRRRVVSLLISFAGVLIILRPGGDLWTPAAGILLAGIAVLGVVRNLTRSLSTTETPECLAFWLIIGNMLVGVALVAVLPAPGFSWPMLAAMALLGVMSATAHWLQSRAFALAPVAALAPYEYTTLIWAGVLGYFVFGDIPSWSTLLGAAVIAGASLWNAQRERVRRRIEAAVPLGGGPAAMRAPLVARRDD